MNSREKFLVGILAIVVIFFGGYKFLVENQIKEFSKTRQEESAVKTEKIELYETLRNIKSITTRIQNTMKHIEKTSNQFLPNLEDDKMHLFFNTKLYGNGITYKSLTMTAPTPVEIDTTRTTVEEIQYPMKDDANVIIEERTGIPAPKKTDTSSKNANQNTKTEQKKDKVSPSAVEMMAVSVEFNATYQQTLSFIKSVIDANKTIRISNINMSVDKETGLLTVNVTFNCYGVKKIYDDEILKDIAPISPGKTDPFR